MGKHEPCMIWLTRRCGLYPNYEVRTLDPNTLQITSYNGGEYGYGFRISRHDARMLARRINQCLDETRAKAGGGAK